MRAGPQNSPDARARWLRRENRRLRWTKGNYVLRQVAAYSYRPSVRRDVVLRLLQTRQWRLAATVALMPDGYSLSACLTRGAQEPEAPSTANKSPDGEG